MSRNKRRRTGRGEQVDGGNKTESMPSLSSLASTKVYFNVISHYITGAGTLSSAPRCSLETHTHTQTCTSKSSNVEVIVN